MAPPIRPARLRIAVVGGGSCDRRQRQLAYETGREIGRQAILLCGGGGGVMAAAAEGAQAAGGLTVGILPGASAGESPPDPHIELPLFTGLGQARNLVIVLSAHAVIAVGGGWGTLSEIALAMKHGVPVVRLESWQVERAGGPQGGPSPMCASTPAEAVQLAIATARPAEGSR